MIFLPNENIGGFDFDLNKDIEPNVKKEIISTVNKFIEKNNLFQEKFICKGNEERAITTDMLIRAGRGFLLSVRTVAEFPKSKNNKVRKMVVKSVDMDIDKVINFINNNYPEIAKTINKYK